MLVGVPRPSPDTTAPSTTIAYSAPFTIPSTATVKFFSTDTDGNVESVNSQQIQIGTTAPATTISCNRTACSTGGTTPLR